MWKAHGGGGRCWGRIHSSWGAIQITTRTCRRGAGTHGDVLNVHTKAFWMDTRVGFQRVTTHNTQHSHTTTHNTATPQHTTHTTTTPTPTPTPQHNTTPRNTTPHITHPHIPHHTLHPSTTGHKQIGYVNMQGQNRKPFVCGLTMAVCGLTMAVCGLTIGFLWFDHGFLWFDHGCLWFVKPQKTMVKPKKTCSNHKKHGQMLFSDGNRQLEGGTWQVTQ